LVDAASLTPPLQIEVVLIKVSKSVIKKVQPSNNDHYLEVALPIHVALIEHQFDWQQSQIHVKAYSHLNIFFIKFVNSQQQKNYLYLLFSI